MKRHPHENIFHLHNNMIYTQVFLLVMINQPHPYIKKSHLFILNSKYEGFANVLVESIMLNTPVISTNCNSGPSEILLNGKLGYLFKVSDFNALSNLILKLFMLEF